MIENTDDSCHNRDLCLCLSLAISANSDVVGSSSYLFNTLKSAYEIVQEDSYITVPSHESHGVSTQWLLNYLSGSLLKLKIQQRST